MMSGSDTRVRTVIGAIVGAMALVILATNVRQKTATTEGFAGQEPATVQASAAQGTLTQQAALEKEGDAQPQAAGGAAKSTSERKKKCEELVRIALRNGVISSVQPLAEDMADIVVGPAFVEAAFEDKETVANVVSCSLATPPLRCVNLRLKDASRNKVIGHYVACRLTMD